MPADGTTSRLPAPTETARSPRAHGWLALAAILAANFAARWPFRRVPFIRDEGEYVHLGQEILRGAIPYVDIYNQKTPLTFYLMAGFQELGGRSVEAIRIATTLYGTITTVFVFLLARALFGPAAALFAAGGFCVMAFGQCGIVHAASTEYFMLLWLAAGAWAWCAEGASRPTWRPVVAGICAGLAVQTKQVGAALLLFFAADAAWRFLTGPRDRASLGRGARSLALAGVGFAMVLAATLVLLAAQGALGAYAEAAWRNNLEYVGRRERDLAAILGQLGRVLRQVARWDLGLWGLGAATLAGVAVRTPAAAGGGMWLLLAGTLAAGLATGGAYVHYYEPSLVPFAVGVGGGSAWLARRALARGSGLRRVVPAALLAAAWSGPAHHLAASLADPDAAVRAQVDRLPPMADAPAAAAYLSEVTRPGEPILVIGSEPQIYFYADRPSSSPMSHTYLLTGPYTFARAKRERFLAELAERGPRYVLLVALSTSLSEYPAGAALLEREVRPVLAAHYAPDRSFPAPPADATPARPHGYLRVYRRLPPGGDETGRAAPRAAAPAPP
jgi:4-amino-4-deoxy-L-arabinose transferase-like glycosyltransferase